MARKRKTYIKSYPLTPLRFVAEKQSGYERFFNFICFILSLGAFGIIGVPIAVHLFTWVWPSIEFKNALDPLWLSEILPNHPFKNLNFETAQAFSKHEYFNLLWAAIPGSLFALTFWFAMKTSSRRSAGLALWRFLGFVCLGALSFSALYFFLFLFEEQKADYWKVSHKVQKEGDEKISMVVLDYALKALGWIICLFVFILPFIVIVFQSLVFIVFKQFTIDYRFQPLAISNPKMIGRPQPDNFFFEHCRQVLNLPPVFSRKNLDSNYKALQAFYAATSDATLAPAKAREAYQIYQFLRPYCFDNLEIKVRKNQPNNGLETEGKH